ncbi:PD40 domain-containing protein [bacterium]|nr:PD40 domain-containing protein [bacterium]
MPRRPRVPPRAPARPRPSPSGDSPGALQLILLLAVAGGMFVLCAGGFGVAWFLAGRQPEGAQERPEAPPPSDPGPPSEPEPDAPWFRRVWAVAHDDGGKGRLLAVSDDGARVFAQDALGVRVLDGRTGGAITRLAGSGVPTGRAELWPVGKDMVMLAGAPQPFPSLWHAATGTQPGEVVPGRALPPATPDAPTRWAVSPDGRYLFVGARPKVGGPAGGMILFKVFEVASAQPVAQTWWQGGNARFTADGQRLFVAETTGRCRSFRVAGGVQEAGWTYPANDVAAPLVSMSADGALLLYDGRPAGLEAGRYLIDGKNGQVLRAVDADTLGVTPDGRHLYGIGDDTVTLSAARTGEPIVREPLPPGSAKAWAFRADGTAFVVHDPEEKELRLYELRGPVPDEPAVATPPALSPVPDPLPPLAFGPPVPPFPPFGPPVPPFPPFGPPPIGPPPPVVTPKSSPAVVTPLPPPPPALKARWNVAAEVGTVQLEARFAPHFTSDGKAIAQHGGSTGAVLVYDATDGAARPTFTGLKGPATQLWLAAFGDRIAAPAADGKVSAWLAGSGAKADPIPFPEMPAGGPSSAALHRVVSPTGRYTAAGRRPVSNSRDPTPVRILDTTTGKLVVDATWQVQSSTGQVAFTTDELRVLVMDGTGKGKWYRLPSGQPDGEWAANPEQTVRTARVIAMTADGSRLVYSGQLPGGGSGAALLDGKTGAVVRRIDNPPYQPMAASLSPDGRLIALPVSEFRDGVQWHVDVLEAATWKKLGRVSPPREHGTDVPLPRFSPDGKTIAVMFRNARRLALYDAPDPAVPLPAAAP